LFCSPAIPTHQFCFCQYLPVVAANTCGRVAPRFKLSTHVKRAGILPPCRQAVLASLHWNGRRFRRLCSMVSACFGSNGGWRHPGLGSARARLSPRSGWPERGFSTFGFGCSMAHDRSNVHRHRWGQKRQAVSRAGRSLHVVPGEVPFAFCVDMCSLSFRPQVPFRPQRQSFPPPSEGKLRKEKNR